MYQKFRGKAQGTGHRAQGTGHRAQGERTASGGRLAHAVKHSDFILNKVDQLHSALHIGLYVDMVAVILNGL